MQWNGTLHSGFLVAAEDKLFLPPIVDAPYGYGAVKVEAQHRNSYALLKMRRLLAMRTLLSAVVRCAFCAPVIAKF